MISFSSIPTSVMHAKRAATQHTQNKNQTLNELSTGKKKADSVSLSRGASLESQLRGLEVATRLAETSAMELAQESASASVRLEGLQGLREIALQAADASIGGSERAALSDRAASMGVVVAGVDFSSAESSGEAIALIDVALEQTVTEMTANGSRQNILELQADYNNAIAIEYAKAASLSADTDIAAAASKLVSDSILQKAAILTQAAALDSQKHTLKLLA